MSKSIHVNSFLSGQKGTILVLVLWVLAILTIIGAYYAVEARIRRNMGQGVWNELQGREAVYSILRLASLKIAPPGADQNKEKEDENINEKNMIRLYPDGTVYTAKFDDGKIDFVLQDESGKISINKATESQLIKLFNAFIENGGEEKAVVLAQSILDWRDSDNIVRDQGAEDSFYSDLVPPYQAADRPFLLLDELMLVRGMDINLYYGPLQWISREDMESRSHDGIQPSWTGDLRDLLSIYNKEPGINMKYAAPPIKKIFEGSTLASGNAGKTICLKIEWEGIVYAVYWARQTNGRFSIIHWTEHCSVENSGHEKENL